MATKVEWYKKENGVLVPTGKFIPPGIWTFLGKASNNQSQFTDQLNSFNTSVKNNPTYVCAIATYNWGLVETGISSRYWDGLDALLDAAAAVGKFIHLAPSYVNFFTGAVNPQVVPSYMWNDKTTYGGNVVGGSWWVSGKPTYGCIYNTNVLEKFLLHYDDIRDRYEDHPAFAGTGGAESAFGTTDPAKTTANYNSAYLAIVGKMGDTFTKHICATGLNFGGGSLITDAIELCKIKMVGIAWPDTIPQRASSAVSANESLIATFREIVPILGHVEGPDYCDWAADSVTFPSNHQLTPNKIVTGRTGDYRDGYTPLDMLFHCMHYIKNTAIPISRLTQNPTHDYSSDIDAAAVLLASMGEKVYVPNVITPDPPGFSGFTAGLVRESTNSFDLTLGAGDYTEIEANIRIAGGAPTAPLQVGIAPDGRTLKTLADGKRFLWKGDTEWMLYKHNKTNRDAIIADRAAKGINVIQISIAFDDEATSYTTWVTNVNGDAPFNPNDMSDFTTVDQAQYYDAYMQVIDDIVDVCNGYGIYAAISGMWGGPFVNKIPTSYPEVAFELGRKLGSRYKDKSNVIWLNVGEYQGMSGWPSSADTAMVNAFINGVAAGDTNARVRMLHPNAGVGNFTSQAFSNVNLNAIGAQTYQIDANSATAIATAYAADNRPILQLEAGYEGRSSPSVTPYYITYECLHSLLQGACGYTYGNDVLWNAGASWASHLNDTGLQYVLNIWKLQASRKSVYVPTQSIITASVGAYASFNMLRAAMAGDASLAFVYFPQSAMTRVLDLTKLTGAGAQLNYYWYNFRDGTCRTDANVVTTAPAGQKAKAASVSFTSPGSGSTNDWVLVIEDPSLSITPPGVGVVS